MFEVEVHIVGYLNNFQTNLCWNKIIKYFQMNKTTAVLLNC